MKKRLYIPFDNLSGGPKSFATAFMEVNNQYEIVTKLKPPVDFLMSIAWFPLWDTFSVMRKNAKIIHRLNGIIPPTNPNAETLMNDMITVMRMANVVVYQSNFCKSLWDCFYKPPNWKVIYNGVNDKIFNPLARAPRKDSTIRLLNASHSTFSSKNLDKIIAISKKVPPGFHLTVIGNYHGNYDAQTVEKESRKIFTGERVEYLPYMSKADLKKQFDKADYYLFPSINEACSNTVIESLCSGLPVIFSDKNPGGTGELVGSAGCAFDFMNSALGVFDFIKKLDRECLQQQAAEKYKVLNSRAMFESYAKLINSL